MGEIIFLGSGGGRFCMIQQLRATGGIIININKENILIDPGPGSLVMAKKFNQNPSTIDYLFVSHIHPDHSTDINVIIEAMTYGTTERRGTLIASRSVIEGINKNESVLTTYHKKMLKNIFIAKDGDNFTFDSFSFKILKAMHSDPTTIGVQIIENNKVITYSSDTAFNNDLIKEYEDSNILILNVLRPNASKIKYHLCTEDAIKIIKIVKPELAIIQHFGVKMLRANPVEEAKHIQNETKVRTIAAFDGMKINLEELKQKTLISF